MSKVLELIRRKALGAGDQARGWVVAQPGDTPLVFDSPHSGTQYPADFCYTCELSVLRRAEDTHVEKLFDFAPAMGIAWVEARFPRSYVDANRSECEIDLDMIDGPWPGAVEPNPAALSKVRLGKGLLWRYTDDGVPLYQHKLQPQAVARRIDRCWRPYHLALKQAIDAAHARHGWCLHLNCHSMPAVAGSHATEFAGLVHPDFVLGDRDGTTASPRLAVTLAHFLERRGYSVHINHPYKGVELVRRYSNPESGIHSLQLEINRKLYMDEDTLALHAGSEGLKRDLQALTDHLLSLCPSDLA